MASIARVATCDDPFYGGVDSIADVASRQGENGDHTGRPMNEGRNAVGSGGESSERRLIDAPIYGGQADLTHPFKKNLT